MYDDSSLSSNLLQGSLKHKENWKTESFCQRKGKEILCNPYRIRTGTLGVIAIFTIQIEGPA